MPQNKAASGGQHRQAPPAGHSQPNGYPMRQRQLHNAARRKRTPPTRQVMPKHTHECIFIQRAQRSEVREKPCSQKRGNRALPRLAAWRSVPQAQTRPAGQSRVIGSRTPGWSHKNGGSSVINAPPDAGASPARPRRQAGGHASRFCIGQGPRSTWDINQRRDVMAWAIKSAPCLLNWNAGGTNRVLS